MQHKGIDDLLVKEEHKVRYGVDASKSSDTGGACPSGGDTVWLICLASTRLESLAHHRPMLQLYSSRSIPTTSAHPTDSRHDSSLAMNSDR